jgi:FKBP-type peptidyl-prolyl cis-trans isomerase 2
MALKNGDFITLDYTERSDDLVVATTIHDVAVNNGIEGNESTFYPRLFIIGSGRLVNGFEEELIGKEVGYEGSVVLPPEKAYGDHNPEKLETVMANRFENKPYVGMQVTSDGKKGTVTRMIGRRAVIDFNHPLAGKTIKYDYKIVSLIEGQQERLSAMIKAFADFDAETKITGDVAEIIVPWEMSYHQQWFAIRKGLAQMIINHIGLKEVHYIEKHDTGQIRADLISPPEKAPEAEAEDMLQQEPNGDAEGSAPSSETASDAAPDTKI